MAPPTPHVILDLDGTVCRTPKGTNMEDPIALGASQPIAAAVAAIQRLHGLGVRVSFLTGRPEAVRQATAQQLLEWFKGLHEFSFVVHHRQRSPFSWDAYTEEKQGVLEEIKPQLYVGDLIHDHDAAHAAGIPFQWADDWRRRGVRIHLGVA